MIGKLMRRCRSNVGDGGDKRHRKLPLNREVVGLNIATMKQAGEGASADYRSSRNRRFAGCEVRHEEVWDSRGERAVRHKTIRRHEILHNCERVRIPEHSSHGQRIIADAVACPDHR